MVEMKRDAIDLGKAKVGSLFKIYFVPTLLGMLSLCIVTAPDGILVGHGVGPEGVAAVNIAIAPFMLLVGFGLMLGMGCSVVAEMLTTPCIVAFYFCGRKLSR